eukprot:superscaffoldBa00001040_g8649
MPRGHEGRGGRYPQASPGSLWPTMTLTSCLVVSDLSLIILLIWKLSFVTKSSADHVAPVFNTHAFSGERGLQKVTDRSVRAVAEHCPELQIVGFMGCPVTSQGVIHLTALRNLSVLDLRHISELNNETVMEVVRKCRNLSSLNLCLNWSINDRPSE